MSTVFSAEKMRVAQRARKINHGFVTGQAVYLNQQNEWSLAKADSEFTLGFGVIERVDKNVFYVVYSGLIYNLSTLDRVGEYYFVSDTVAGELTHVEPISSSSFSNPILLLIYKNVGLVLNMRPESLALPDVKFESQAVYPIKSDSTSIYLEPDNSSHGDLLFRNSTSWERLPAGSPGQLLSTNGEGQDPSWKYSLYKSYIPITLGKNATEYLTSTIYYIGSMQNVENRIMQNANIQKIKSPIDGRVIKINHIIFANSGSAEACSFKIKNSTKNTHSQSWSLPINSISGINTLIDLNLEVSEGDDLLMIMETPDSWSSTPSQVQQSCIMYIEPKFEISDYILNP